MQHNTGNTTTIAPPRAAVVIGGSVGGLLAARVLADFFDQVTIVERDFLPDRPAFRRGAPQARHPHGLFVRGQRTVEALFPGLMDELCANGASRLNMGHSAFYMGGQWLQSFDSALESIACTRSLIEHGLRQRLEAWPQVHILQAHAVDGLCTDVTRNHITGVRVRSREQRTSATQVIPASLVVDASGRSSALPRWLTALGFPAPAEVTTDAKAAYATRIYSRVNLNTGLDPEMGMMYYMPEAPHQSRGGIIMPIEGTNGANDSEERRWLVTLIGMNGDQPPTDSDGFMEFARSLPSPELYQAIEEGEPLTVPYGYAQAANRLRKYDELPRYVEGLVALGDSVCALNPVYGQGMTMAALGAELLGKSLRKRATYRRLDDLNGFAHHFQRKLSGIIAGPWQLATGQDLRWPMAAQGHTVTRMDRAVNAHFSNVLHTMTTDAVVAEAFFYVQNMLRSPATLFHPRILWRVWKAGRSRTRSTNAPGSAHPAPLAASGA